MAISSLVSSLALVGKERCARTHKHAKTLVSGGTGNSVVAGGIDCLGVVAASDAVTVGVSVAVVVELEASFGRI